MNATLRVLHVSAAAERGGLEVVLLNILKSLDRTRFTPHVLFLSNGPFVEEVKATDTETHVIDGGRLRQLMKTRRAIAAVEELIRNRRIDIVHCHNAKAHVYGGQAARRAGVPCVFHLHGIPRFSLSRDGVVSLFAIVTPAQSTIACSRYVASAFTHAWHSRRQIAVIHNGVSPEVVSMEDGRSLRHQLGIADGATLVLMPTRLQRQKGVHVFLEAAARVVAKHPDVRFVVVGGALFGLEPDYPLLLQRQVEESNLGEVVKLVGFSSDVMRFFAAADLVVNSSIEPESFATVLLEAMACSKPVIASDSGGAREVVEQGVTGLLVPPRDAGLLAEAISAMVVDRDQRIRMGKAGAARARDHFSADRMTRRLEGIYQGLGCKDKGYHSPIGGTVSL